MRIDTRAASLLWRWAPLIGYLAIIFLGSSISKLPDPGVSDKTAHMTEYFVLGILTVRALAGAAWSAPSLATVLGAMVLCALYGVSDEVHQRFVPGRQFDYFDMLADACGASLGASALWAWGIIRRFFLR